MGNVTATARIGTRVIRVIGTSGVRQQYVNELLDYFIEHVRQQAERAPKSTVPRRCQAGSTLEL